MSQSHVLNINTIEKQAVFEQSGLPPQFNLEKLEEAGIIEGYGAKVNTDVLFKRTSVMVEVTLKEHSAQAFKRFE